MICRIGPVAQYHENSRYYSAVPAEANPDVDTHLPHVTIEMPVYKESLEETMYVISVPIILKIHSMLIAGISNSTIVLLRLRL
jgi:hypothetical protein